MNAFSRLLVAIAAVSVSVPAAAQLSGGSYDSEQFVKAIRESKSNDAVKLIQSRPSLANARDLNGQTALDAAIENRDEDWTGYLLQQGADPNVPSGNGDTPLMAAARIGFPQAVDWLIGLHARLDASNRRGETALILAVQQRQIPIVRSLVNAGADPDKTDSAAGYSARDYARRDSRTPELLRIIKAKKPKP